MATQHSFAVPGNFGHVVKRSLQPCIFVTYAQILKCSPMLRKLHKSLPPSRSKGLFLAGADYFFVN